MKNKKGKLLKKKEVKEEEEKMKNRRPIQFVQLRPSDFKSANKKADGSKD